MAPTAQQNSLVSILIVCYNSRPLIHECLASLSRHVAVPHDIWLLDNGSDGCDEYVKNHFPAVHVLQNHRGRGQNVGFGRANNILAEHAKGDYFLLINPDTRTQSDIVRHMLATARKYEDHGVWGGLTLHPDGSDEPSSQQYSPTLFNEMLLAFGLKKLIRSRKKITDTIFEVPSVSGAFMMVEKKLWQQLGGFDETFFLYSEELDLCTRAARQCGKCPIMDTSVCLMHHEGASSDYATRTQSILRGKMHYSLKHFSKFRSCFLFLILWALVVSRLVSSFGYSENSRRKRAMYRTAALKPRTWASGYWCSN